MEHSFLTYISAEAKKQVIGELKLVFEKQDIVTSDFIEPRCGCDRQTMSWIMWKLPKKGKAEHDPKGWFVKRTELDETTFVAECNRCFATHTWKTWR